MDALSLILLGVILTLVFVIVTQRRARNALVHELQSARDLASTNSKLLEEAQKQTRAPVEPPPPKNEGPVKVLQEKLAIAEQKTSELEAERQRAQARTKTLEDELEATQAKARDLEQRAATAKDESAALQKEIAATRVQVETQRREIETVRARTKQLQDEIEAAQRHAQQQATHVERAREQTQQVETEATRLRSELEAVKRELERTLQDAASRAVASASSAQDRDGELQRIRLKAEELAKELAGVRAEDEARIRGLTNALRLVEEDLATALMQKEAFSGEARTLRDELERRKKAAEADAKPVPKAKPTKPPEPLLTYFCLVCGEGGSGPKPHRCMVEELEAQKRAAGKR